METLFFVGKEGCLDNGAWARVVVGKEQDTLLPDSAMSYYRWEAGSVVHHVPYQAQSLFANPCNK